MGVPIGAAMSMPLCMVPQRGPNPDVKVPWVGGAVGPAVVVIIPVLGLPGCSKRVRDLLPYAPVLLKDAPCRGIVATIGADEVAGMTITCGGC